MKVFLLIIPKLWEESTSYSFNHHINMLNVIKTCL